MGGCFWVIADTAVILTSIWYWYYWCNRESTTCRHQGWLLYTCSVYSYIEHVCNETYIIINRYCYYFRCISAL